MPNFKVLSHFRLRKWLSKIKKARFNPFVPPTHFQQQVGWGTRLAKLALPKTHFSHTLVQPAKPKRHFKNTLVAKLYNKATPKTHF